ncbi:carboxylesterase/lipase family protein [Streptomyces flavofungini]|uniref:carboxylesterase/lipase family protein n=1 Tax=Streptomyces flavofungini TaxID=68200 RepID=UPI0025B232E7|nr:carboxylesterase family protein [Streptomyces flavofungini]WJV50206.1 carboxylesterase family protein [Streptomyces flavofungini]
MAAVGVLMVAGAVGFAPEAARAGQPGRDGQVVSAGWAAQAGQAGQAGRTAQAGAGERGERAGSGGAGGSVVVRTDAGRVRGRVTDEGRRFLGIPYARQPVGALRWKEPRPVAPWHGVRAATEFGNRCVQTASWDPGYEKPSHTEDCLALNVYAPAGRAGPARTTDDARRPVLVWLHGGGLTAGAGEDVVPERFARTTGTVVVTVNYRLGALGFLASPALDGEASDGVSGNYGLLDQQAALRWVRANIGRFGGDPRRVTVAGESAGGRSVCTHLASPTGRGLFRAAVIQSGAYDNCAGRTRRQAAVDGAAFAGKAGCPDAATALACLRRKPAKDLLAAQAAFDWGPVVGGNFLPVQPEEAFERGSAAKVPVLNGANTDEGTLFAFAQFDGKGRPLTAERYPAVLEERYGAGLAERVARRYPLGRYPSPTHALAATIGDQLFACPALRLDRSLAGRGPVYAYEFADRTSPPFASLRDLGTDFAFGATHVNEVQYLFQHFGLRSPLNAEQRALARQMTAYWGSFIHSGVPRADGAPPAPDQRTHPGDTLSLRTGSAGGTTLDPAVHRAHHCALWDAAAPR